MHLHRPKCPFHKQKSPPNAPALQKEGPVIKGYSERSDFWCTGEQALLRAPGGERDGARRAMSVTREPRGFWGQSPHRSTLGAAPLIRQFISAKKTDRGQSFLWRWADSNRRPNKVPEGFLHAYSSFDCRRGPAGRRARPNLSPKSWRGLRESPRAGFLDDTP